MPTSQFGTGGYRNSFKKTSTTLEVGSFTYLPPKMNHFLWASVPAVFQIHAEGPFDIVYVNPNDDPSKPHM